MRRTEQLQGLRLMKFEDVYGRCYGGDLSQVEASEILGVSERTFRRWRDRYEAEGAEGLYDRRLGRVSARRAAVDTVARVLELFETRYRDFTAKHFHEKLVAEHGFGLSYNWLRLTLQAHGRVRPAPRRGAHRRKRSRRPMAGMMLHQDGSSHEWVAGQWWDLIVTLDDATSEVYSGFFVAEEGTMSTFRALGEVIAATGLFCSLYTDRGSHYWHTPEAGGGVDKDNPTQVGRALDQLGIELIPAYSPEVRGRSERMFGTLQRRLPQELRLAGISTMEDANRFLRHHSLDEGADAKADRILQGIEPILTGKWTGRRRCRKMFHGVSSFRRLHTAFLNVLQSGVYASSPIFHQPCDTTVSKLLDYISRKSYTYIRMARSPENPNLEL